MNELTLRNEDCATRISLKKRRVLAFKRRMLQWPNPVEYVNNMYGCHPDDCDSDYFKEIFTYDCRRRELASSF